MQHGLVTLQEVHSPTGELIDAYARVDKKLVLEKGKEVMGKLLLEIQVRKSTGDAAGATGSSFLSSSTAQSLISHTFSVLQGPHQALDALGRQPPPTRPREEASAQDLCPAQHGHRRWRGRAQGVPRFR